MNSFDWYLAGIWDTLWPSAAHLRVTQGMDMRFSHQDPRSVAQGLAEGAGAEVVAVQGSLIWIALSFEHYYWLPCNFKVKPLPLWALHSALVSWSEKSSVF